MKTLLVIAVLLGGISPALADTVPVHSIAVGHVNTDIELQALIRTDRLPRSKATFWLRPGKVYRWYYTWVLQDGSTVTKVESKPIKGIQDDRPFNQSHPNLSIGLMVGNGLAGPIAGGMVGLIHH